MRYVSLVLIVMLGLVQAELWMGHSGMPRMLELRRNLGDQLAINQAERDRNGHLLAEVKDLKEGLEMVEEKARFELGMIKPNEILVQLTAPHR